MIKNNSVVIDSDCYTPLEYISDTKCYIGKENLDIRMNFFNLFGLEGQKSFFKTLFYSYKLENDIGKNEFSDIVKKYVDDMSALSIFRYYACDEIYNDWDYLYELFAITNVTCGDVKELYDYQKSYKK